MTTKIGHDTTGQDIPLSHENVHDHVRASLDNLGVEVIDLLLYHCDDPVRPVTELADTLVSLVEAGHVRRVGVSNWRAEHLTSLAHELAERGHALVGSYQFSLAERVQALLEGSLRDDATVLGVVHEHRLLRLGWSSQARGFFVRAGTEQVNGRPDPYDTEDNRALRRRCRELAGQLGTRPETVALAWTLHHPGIWPSISPRTTEQIDRSLEARRLALTGAQVRWLQHGG